MITQGLQPYANTTAEPSIQFLGLPTIMRATRQTTNGAFGLVEHLVIPPGFASPYHTHHLEDEAFYVLEGEMAFVCDGQWTLAGPGTYVFGPRNIPHGFKVRGDAPARMLLLCAPGGFEQFVVEMGEPVPAPPDMTKLMAMAAKYEVEIHGPLPQEPAGASQSENVAATTGWFTSLRRAVDETRSRHVAAVRAGDAEAATMLFAPDGIFLPPGQPALEGTAAIRAWFVHVFANFRLQDFILRPGGVEARGDVAIEYGNWQATFTPKNGSADVPAGGTYLTVYARLVDGSVRMVHDTFNGMPG